MTERKILKWHPLQNLPSSGWFSSHSSFPLIFPLPTASLSGLEPQDVLKTDVLRFYTRCSEMESDFYMGVWSGLTEFSTQILYQSV